MEGVWINGFYQVDGKIEKEMWCAKSARQSTNILVSLLSIVKAFVKSVNFNAFRFLILEKVKTYSRSLHLFFV